jgi:hypothetical protein
MGWSIGFDPNWDRDVGYGVPAMCDHPGCTTKIDRGLGYVCGNDVYGGEDGCGLFFCCDHRHGPNERCARCRAGKDPFKPSADLTIWIRHKLTDPSWARWRRENPVQVERLRATVGVSS